MWTPCTVVLDEEVMVLVWEYGDLVKILLFPFVAQFVVGMLRALLVAMVLLALAYVLKRHKPPGAIPHLCHRLGLWGLRGVLSPLPQRYSLW